MDDDELIDMIRSGDRSQGDQAFKRIYNGCKAMCLAFMKKRWGEREELLDIYQDAEIVLWEKLIKPDVELRCTIETFLISICRNQCLKHFGKPPRIDPLEDDLPEITDWLDTLEHAEKEERLQAILEILDNPVLFGERCKEVLHRRFYLDETYAQIAVAMKYQNATVIGNLIHRCKQELQELVLRRHEEELVVISGSMDINAIQEKVLTTITWASNEKDVRPPQSGTYRYVDNRLEVKLKFRDKLKIYKVNDQKYFEIGNLIYRGEDSGQLTALNQKADRDILESIKNIKKKRP